MTKVTLSKFGRSAGVIIPDQFIEQLGWKEGEQLGVTTEKGKLVMSPVTQQKYSLDELVATCDENAPMPEGLAEWEGVEPVGSES